MDMELETWKRKVNNELATLKRELQQVEQNGKKRAQETSALKGKFAALQKDIKEAKEGLKDIETLCKQNFNKYDQRFEMMDNKKARKGTARQSMDIDSIQTPKDVLEVAQRAFAAATHAEEILEKFDFDTEKGQKIIPYDKIKEKEVIDEPTRESTKQRWSRVRRRRLSA